MKSLRNIGLFPIIISLAMQSFAQGSAVYNKIDGFSSASNKLHVDSVLVYRDHADVFWWEFYGDTADILKYQIEWGTKDSINYSDTLRLQPFTKQTRYVSKIQPLRDSTAYFAQFHRDYHGTVKKTKFLINTPPMNNAVQPIQHINRPWVMPSVKNITGIDVFTVSGRLLFHTNVIKGVAINSLRTQITTPGLYVINYTGASNKIIKSEMNLFGR